MAGVIRYDQTRGIDPSPIIDPNSVDYAISAFERQKIGPLDLAGFLVKRGFLLIGTVISQSEHAPQAVPEYFDMDLRMWTYVDNNQSPLLRATSEPRAAAMCAIFGDYNLPGQRDRIRPKLTEQERPHFGWQPSRINPGSLALHALAEVIQKAHQLGADLTGSIDAIQFDPLSFYPVDPRVEPGHWLSPQAHQTIYGIPITALDLPNDIRAVQYTHFNASKLSQAMNHEP